ncbi:MAG: outer membrane lipid asymmetry maintenance protein MlaD [Gammaproteobacteria bacterium]|nr:MAG: outer membrane lipid asymmetry maintenance protein MlaD [Gammaproteobacteria bacterium]
MRNNIYIEVMVGLFMAFGMAALLVLAFRVSEPVFLSSEDDTYNLTARFENIGGLKVRSPVKMGGVKIGQVADIQFDQERYEAVVTLRIYKQYNKLPVDTSASIFSAGLLGEQYISLEPGSAFEYLKDRGEISLTQSVLIIEQLLSQFLYNMADKK